MNNRSVTILVVSLVILCLCGLCMTCIGWFLFTHAGRVNTSINSPVTTNTPFPSPVISATPGTCVVSGCSGTLCIDSNDQNNGITDCIWSDSYACYKQAICERQQNGKCGWTYTPAYNQCLKDLAK